MESVILSKPTADSQFDDKKCIMCQNTTHDKTVSTDNGRKRVQEASEVRNDHVTKRLKLVKGNNFVYHMTNKCYREYTNKSNLARFVSVIVYVSCQVSENLN